MRCGRPGFAEAAAPLSGGTSGKAVVWRVEKQWSKSVGPLHDAAMVRFECVRCGTAFTGALREVPAPPYLGNPGGHTVYRRPHLAEPGTYFDDLSGRRRFPDAPGSHVLAPGDVFGTQLVFEACGDGCIGITSPPQGNLLCAGCGAMVGAHTDACGAWFETRLNPSAVRPMPASGAPEWSEPAARAARQAGQQALLGTGPGDEGLDPRTYTLWRHTLVHCVAEVLSASGGGLIAPTGRGVRGLAAIAAKLIGPGRLRSLDAARTRGARGVGHLLDEVDAWEHPGTLTLLSFERSAAELERSAAWLAGHARRLGRELPTLRLVNVGPQAPVPEVGPVRSIGLAEPIFRYLERASFGDRALAATHWRGQGLADEAFRDEALDLDYEPSAPDALASGFWIERWLLGRELQSRAEAGETCLYGLVERLLPAAWLRPRPEGPAAGGTGARTETEAVGTG